MPLWYGMVSITREMRDPNNGHSVVREARETIPETEPGTKVKGIRTPQEVRGHIHGKFGSFGDPHAKLLFGGIENRRKTIAAGLKQMSSNNIRLNSATKMFLENLGAVPKNGVHLDKFLDELFEEKKNIAALRKAVRHESVNDAILHFTNVPPIKFWYAQPYFHTTSGIAYSKLEVSDSFLRNLRSTKQGKEILEKLNIPEPKE